MNLNLVLKKNSNFLEDYKAKILDISLSKQNQKKKINISMKYKIDDLINLLGEDFVKINKKKCWIIYEGKIKGIKTKMNIKKKSKYFIKVKLIILANLISLKGMFYKSNNLISVKNLEGINTRNIKDLSYLFAECTLIETLPDISN